MMSEEEKAKRKHEKELKSLRNKMGPNIVWFDSLTKKQQFDILFLWKSNKFSKRNLTEPVYVKVRKSVLLDENKPWRGSKRIYVNELKYPASLKHFIKECRKFIHPKINAVRQTTIDILLGEK